MPSPARTDKSPPSANTGMDRHVRRRTPRWLVPLMFTVLLAIVLGTGSMFLTSTASSLKVQSDRITIASVTNGTFDDTLPIRGIIGPARTVFLDAIEGGRVDAILVEDGAFVEAGTPLARLSNTTLQLDVIAREAEVTEQINNLSTLELELAQNQLEQTRTLVDVDYQIRRLEQLVARRAALAPNDVSVEEVGNLREELAYNRRLREVTLHARDTSLKLQDAQQAQIKSSVERLRLNLDIARRNLDALNITAPVSGQLTAFTIEIGQSLARGDRLGRIDDPSRFKVTVPIDEFYLSRVNLGQAAILNLDDTAHTFTVTRVRPDVRDGRFDIDLAFMDEAPRDIRRGQSLQGHLVLGAPEPARLIPTGAFYNDTGGAWIFVLGEDGVARRRPVRLGRRNARFIEVLDGLDPGERVIVSSYARYLDSETLSLAP